MCIDDAGRDPLAGGIDDARVSGGRDALADGGDLPALEQQEPRSIAGRQP